MTILAASMDRANRLLAEQSGAEVERVMPTRSFAAGGDVGSRGWKPPPPESGRVGGRGGGVCPGQSVVRYQEEGVEE